MPIRKTNGERECAAALRERCVRLRSFVEQLPDAHTVEHGNHLSLEVRRKRFGWLLDDHHGDGRLALHCKSNDRLRERLKKQSEEQFHVPKHVGHHGWVGLWLDTPGRVNWSLVEAAVVEAYRMTAPQTLIAQLQDHDPPASRADRRVHGNAPRAADDERRS